MNVRTAAGAVALLLALAPATGAGQTSSEAATPAEDARTPARLSVQVAAGPALPSTAEGSVLSAQFGYSPALRFELLLNVERDHVPVRVQRFDDGYSATRGATLTFVSGELRVLLWRGKRVSTFATAGAGGGVSRLNVNAMFPDPVRNDLRVLYAGGGVRVPLRRGISLLADARYMLGVEGSDGVLALWPVRAGVAWRF